MTSEQFDKFNEQSVLHLNSRGSCTKIQILWLWTHVVFNCISIFLSVIVYFIPLVLCSGFLLHIFFSSLLWATDISHCGQKCTMLQHFCSCKSTAGNQQTYLFLLEITPYCLLFIWPWKPALPPDTWSFTYNNEEAFTLITVQSYLP